MPPLSDINFTPYIPTTAVGLLGLIFGYLYFYLKNRNDNKLKQIESVRPEDRKQVIEATLNEIGVSIDTSNLTGKQRYNLLSQSLKAKTKKYLVISITTIILSGIIYLLVNPNKEISNQPAAATNTYYRDNDGDGYGDINNATTAAEQPPGHVQNTLDCCDDDKNIHDKPSPSIEETPVIMPLKIFTRQDVLDYYNAAQSGNTELVKRYVQLDMPADTAIDGYNAALPNAVAYGQTEITRFLLDKGCNPNHRYIAESSFIGSTPLIQAAYSNFTDIVDLLIKYNAVVDMTKLDGDAMTALMFACIQGNSAIVQKLLNAGANPNARRASNGATAKDFANELPSPKKDEILQMLNLSGAKSGG